MSSVSPPREYFLDSTRAWLMLLGIPLHIPSIYSTRTWYVNSAESPWWLTLLNNFIHAFRVQVFFVIPGYFPYILFLRYPSKRWWKVRAKHVGVPTLTVIPLLTLPRSITLQHVKGKTDSWHTLSGHDKYNALAWELISHLWSSLVLVMLMTLSMWMFAQMENRLLRGDGAPASGVSMTKLTLIFILLGVGYAAVRRTIFILYPSILSDGIFNFIVMQMLFYVPFFMLGTSASINPNLKALFTTLSRGCILGAAFTFVAYLLNQRYGNGDVWVYETEYVITMVMGLRMVNVVFSLGHRLSNFQSARVIYFVNASLFIYLVYHPLALFLGAYITPYIKSDLLSFLCGLLFVVGAAVTLYEIHLRIPALKLFFLGKPPIKQDKNKVVAG